MTKQIWIKRLLLLGSCYLLIDALIHLFNIRLIDVETTWPSNAISFAGFMSQIYASFVLLTAFIVWEIQKDIRKYQNIISIMGFWAIGQGIYLLIRSFNGLAASLGDIPSLLVWTPFYQYITTFESLLLLLFGTIVILWRFKNGKNS